MTETQTHSPANNNTEEPGALELFQRNRGLTIQVTANNLLNGVNYSRVDTTVNSPTFGQILAVGPMRSAQLNIRFRF